MKKLTPEFKESITIPLQNYVLSFVLGCINNEKWWDEFVMKVDSLYELETIFTENIWQFDSFPEFLTSEEEFLNFISFIFEDEKLIELIKMKSEEKEVKEEYIQWFEMGPKHVSPIRKRISKLIKDKINDNLKKCNKSMFLDF